MNNISENAFCSGCGVCSAVCPKNCISTEENTRGELRAKVNPDICVSCGKCKTVCPSFNGVVPDNRNETVYLGVAPDFEKNGSSGGVATYFFNALLESKTVNFAVLVKPQNDSDELFSYTICKTTNETKKCQGSAYYPVTLEKVLRDMNSIDGTFAVIGVPCFINALKNLKASSDVWDKKIKFLIGIVCGHTPNKHLVDCLAYKSGHNRADITSCRFRIKDTDRPAWDYGVRLSFSDKKEFKSFGSDDFGFLFWRRLFIGDCCLNCRDVFAENADITFMDAWLPEYKEKPEGTSLIVCRNEELKSLLSPLVEDGSLKETKREDIYTAQEKLVAYKQNAGKHGKDKKLAEETQKVFSLNKGKKDIVERLRRVVYKQNLKRKNPLLWLLVETKDRLKR